MKMSFEMDLNMVANLISKGEKLWSRGLQIQAKPQFVNQRINQRSITLTFVRNVEEALIIWKNWNPMVMVKVVTVSTMRKNTN